ncbi:MULTISPECIES: nuclear transport factor 2 family protein [Streptomyces]|uniref:nuclear transport factor 2 family protein n=1 Tax=Streptomyces lycopersici TaxID=2974589 RepID=UPI0021D3308A|nr:nuclear transport factor 2 family protein [Streptomyces sp. NEAU-383]
MPTEALDPMERLLSERACERLIVEFVRRLDLGDPSSVADLFTPDGVCEWPHGNRRVEGREALRSYFGSRPKDRLSRRMSTNILVTVNSASAATATSYFATYRVDGYIHGMVSPRLPANVGHYEDTFRKIEDTWLLTSRVTHLPLGGETARLSYPDQS